jgi:hypothetical protein
MPYIKQWLWFMIATLIEVLNAAVPALVNIWLQIWSWIWEWILKWMWDKLKQLPIVWDIMWAASSSSNFAAYLTLATQKLTWQNDIS